ncbi:hypothetical protein BDZ97DRAFT_1677217, partial [Flammula alnicola]
PLLIKGLVGIKSLYDAKPVAIHILDQPARCPHPRPAHLERPFKTVSMFGPAAGPQTDATITV